MTTLKQRITADNVRAESVWTERPEWADFGDHWYNVTLKRKGRQLTVPFGMGSALTDDPTAQDVLDCLLSDASGYENARSFEEWASEYGYDTDSRKAERVYEQVKTQTHKLRKFLGEDFDAYVWETDND